jgi:hypothetical protein
MSRNFLILAPCPLETFPRSVLYCLSVEVIGKDKRAIRLFHDATSTPQEIGLWFFKEKHETDKPERTYAMVHYPNGTARVTCSAWIRECDLMAVRRKVGKASFLIALDKDWMTGGEFYKAKLD